MKLGELTVTGNNSTRILLDGWPHEIFVDFKKEIEHVPCNPHHHDFLEYFIDCVDEDPRHHHDPGHHHQNRQFYLVIKWKVSGIREILWYVFT